jgi:hypothetical protein
MAAIEKAFPERELLIQGRHEALHYHILDCSQPQAYYIDAKSGRNVPEIKKPSGQQGTERSRSLMVFQGSA